MFLTGTMPEVETTSAFLDFVTSLTWEKILPTLIAMVISLLVVKIATTLFNKAISRSRIEPTLQPTIRTAFKFLMLTLAVLIVAGTIGLDVSVLVAVFSVLSLAVSLAVQGTLSNMVGGLVILTSHPFKVEDYVDIGGTAGTIEKIGMTYTDLITPDNQHIHIPNSTVSAAIVVNYSAAGTRRMDLRISASYDAPIETVKSALLAATRIEGVLTDPAPEAHLLEYGDNAMLYTLRCWTETAVYWDVYFAVLERVKETFDDYGVEMSYPHMNVHFDAEH